MEDIAELKEQLQSEEESLSKKLDSICTLIRKYNDIAIYNTLLVLGCSIAVWEASLTKPLWYLNVFHFHLPTDPIKPEFGSLDFEPGNFSFMPMLTQKEGVQLIDEYDRAHSHLELVFERLYITELPGIDGILQHCARLERIQGVIDHTSSANVIHNTIPRICETERIWYVERARPLIILHNLTSKLFVQPNSFEPIEEILTAFLSFFGPITYSWYLDVSKDQLNGETCTASVQYFVHDDFINALKILCCSLRQLVDYEVTLGPAPCGIALAIHPVKQEKIVTRMRKGLFCEETSKYMFPVRSKQQEREELKQEDCRVMMSFALGDDDQDFVYSSCHNCLYCITNYVSVEAWDLKDTGCPIYPVIDPRSVDDKNYPWAAVRERDGVEKVVHSPYLPCS
ncbi:hypothetical protein OROGR_027993 [Orobanche gracilis]